MDSFPDTDGTLEHTAIVKTTGSKSGFKDDADGQVLVVTESGKTILVHHPAGKTVTIGRSKSNDICLEKPHIPKRLGEMVLGPVPVFRKSGSPGEKGPSILPVHPQKPIRVNPYQIQLLKHGDVFFSHPCDPMSAGKKKHLPIVLLLVLLVGAASLCALFFQAKSNILKNQGTELNLDPRDSQLYLENTEKTATRETSPPSGWASAEVPLVINPEKPKKNPERFGKPPDPGDKAPSDQGGIPSDRFEEILQAAKDSLNLGKPEYAGRALLPLLPYLSNRQKEILIESLEPLFKTLFHKAYMLMAYDRLGAGSILYHLEKSGLDFLPSYAKAKDILDRERQTRAAFKVNDFTKIPP